MERLAARLGVGGTSRKLARHASVHTASLSARSWGVTASGSLLRSAHLLAEVRSLRNDDNAVWSKAVVGYRSTFEQHPVWDIGEMSQGRDTHACTGSQPGKNVGKYSRRGNDIDRGPEAKILVDPGRALGTQSAWTVIRDNLLTIHLDSWCRWDPAPDTVITHLCVWG